MNVRTAVKRILRPKRPFVFEDQFGMRFQLYPDQDDVETYLGRRSVSDAQNIIRYVMSTVGLGQRCMDIGAHIGSVSVAMANQVGSEGRVVAVEPDPSNSFRVAQNLLLNGHSDNFCVLPFAVGAHAHIGCLTVFPSANGWQTLNSPGDFTDGHDRYTIRVLVKSFLELLEIADLDGRHIDFVKIDTEGSELTILRAMRSLLESGTVGQIIFECSDLTTSNIGLSCADLVAFWDNLPYSLFKIDPKGKLAPVKLAPGRNHFDCVAVFEQRHLSGT